jgi:hypothetical protein
MKFITDNTPANEHNPLAYLDISIAGQPGAGELWNLPAGTALQDKNIMAPPGCPVALVVKHA